MGTPSDVVISVAEGPGTGTSAPPPTAEKTLVVDQPASETSPKVKPTKREAIPLKQLFRFANGFDAFLYSVALLCALGTGAVMPLQTLLLGLLINGTSNPAEFEDNVNRIALYMTFVAIGAFACNLFGTAFCFVASERQVRRVRIGYMRALLRQDIAFFDSGLGAEAAARLAEDTIAIQAGLGAKLYLIIAGIAQFIGNVILAFAVSQDSWRMALVVLAVVPLILIVFAVLFGVVKDLSGESDDAYAKAGEVLTETLTLIRTVAAFGGEEAEVRRYDTQLAVAEAAGIKKGYTSGVSQGTFVFVLNLMYAIGLYAGARFIVLNREDHPDCVDDYTPYYCFSGGQVVQTLFAMVGGAAAMGLAAPNFNYVASAQAAAYRIFRIIDKRPSIDSADNNGLKPASVNGLIEFRNVTFAYPVRAQEPVLRNFSLVIEPGKTFALCGPSGSGKSTIVALIQRWYDPQEGEILLDGRNIKEYNVQWLRTQMALVNQEPQLLPMSIAQNVALGKPGASNEEVEAAAKAANAHDFISSLPNGYETAVTGTQLSGGEKQRVAIARAVIRRARILLLDEATSALDTASERAIQRDLDRLLTSDLATPNEKPTALIIAHRLSTITEADRIIVLRDGAVVESGTHAELLSAQGLYNALWSVQQVTAGISKEQHGITTAAGVNNKVTQGPASQTKKSNSTETDPTKASKKKEEDDKDDSWKKLPPVPWYKVWRYMRPQARWLFPSVVTSLLNGVILPAFAILLSRFVEIFFLDDTDEMIEQAGMYMGFFFAVGVGSFLVGFISAVCWARASERFLRAIRRDTFAALIKQDVGYFDLPHNSVGRVATRLGINAARLKLSLGPRLGEQLSSVSTLIVSLVVGFTASWQLTLICLVLGPVMVFATQFDNAITFGLDSSAQAYAEAGGIANDAVSNMRVVTAFGLQQTIATRFYECILKPSAKAIRTSWKLGFGFGLSNFLQPISGAIIFFVGARLAKDGVIAFQDILLVFFSLQFGTIGLMNIVELAKDVRNIKSATRGLFAIMDRQTVVDGTAAASGASAVDIRGEIEFSNVNFAYPTRPDRMALQNMSFVVQPGQVAAIVGRSGSGKSSIVQLMMRFYVPQEGFVKIDGVDIADYKPRDLRDNVGWVQQEAPLFSETLLYNIAYGRNGGITNKPLHSDEKQQNVPEDVLRAATAANCMEYINKFEHGFCTTVGERGAQLSGGQKQRAAIARSIIRTPRVLLLDEATSALDSESERLVQASIDALLDDARAGRRSMTTLIIAHRLSTVRNADVVLVVDEGRIAEFGRYEDLLADQSSIFAQLVKAQAGHATS